MESIFYKDFFPKAPGGNLYEWKNAETLFTNHQAGLFVIQVIAMAKSAKQNNSTDDDDLRVVLDGFSFGKYEKHDEEVSFKGFGTSASFDGASQKNGTKINYFFVELEKGNHKIQFFADETPTIKSIEIFFLVDNQFVLNNLEPQEKIDSDQKGIPWLSFIFLGTRPKNILLDVSTKSAKEKSSTDGDNLKVILNGKILKNKQAPNSKKYQNFYFSGDLKSTEILSITNYDLSKSLAFENSMELWYDQMPKINSLKIDFFDTEQFLKEYVELVDLRYHILFYVGIVLVYFKATSKFYSEKFLQHSIEENPSIIVFKANHPIVRNIKDDPTYNKILEKLKRKIAENILEGEIWPEDLGGKINFDSADLATAIHGIKKIEYSVQPKKNGKFEVKMILLDIYDFQKTDMPFFLFHPFQYLQNTALNAIDMGEDLNVINNFEIQIYINDLI